MTLLHDARMARKSGTSDFGATSHTTNTGTASEQLDNIYFRERDAPKDGNNELIESAIYELNQLDDSLDELFKDAYVDFETHQQIHKFRLRVSRRISAFGSILRKLLKYTENTTAANKLKLQSLHRLYLDHLMRHKSMLSDWWSRNEHRYHNLCLSSFVSEASENTQL